MITYVLSGLHCNACVTRLTTALQAKLPAFNITLNPPRLVVQGAAPDLAALNKHLAEAGDYSAHVLGGEARGMAAGGPDNSLYSPPVKSTTWLATYRPVLLIVAYLLLIAALTTSNWHDAMRVFMAGFFLVFSLFKFFDLAGFAKSYARYNLLAMRWRGYGYTYPFIELALGLAFLTNIAPYATNLTTLVLSLFAGLGVGHAIVQKKQLQCACLGSGLSLPVGVVTLVEDFGMAAMAAIMLFMVS